MAFRASGLPFALAARNSAGVKLIGLLEVGELPQCSRAVRRPDGEVVGDDDHVYVAPDVEVAARHVVDDEGCHQAVVRGESLDLAPGRGRLASIRSRILPGNDVSQELLPGRVHECDYRVGVRQRLTDVCGTGSGLPAVPADGRRGNATESSGGPAAASRRGPGSGGSTTCLGEHRTEPYQVVAPGQKAMKKTLHRQLRGLLGGEACPVVDVSIGLHTWNGLPFACQRVCSSASSGAPGPPVERTRAGRRNRAARAIRTR